MADLNVDAPHIHSKLPSLVSQSNMKQILQNLSSGETLVENVPMSGCALTEVRIRSVSSLISLGTERMLVDFGRGNLIQKARQQPEKVQMVLEKAVTDGVMATYGAVKSKLDQPLPLGYCQAGVVLEANDSEFEPGDRVVSNGHHAEIVSVSRNLVARIPDSVSFEEATFVPVAAIGLQGIRLAAPQIGETVVVMGLGLIGLLTVQMLIAQGCSVIGTDFDDSKLALAKSYGAQIIDLKSSSNPVSEALAMTNQVGVDCVLVTASTASDDPITHAARMSRKRGKIILVGVVGLKLNRSDFYEKELTFQVSCSYGPGRYDESYENNGVDYPVGYVRWTEKRNFEAVLGLMASGRLSVSDLISERYLISDAETAYERVATDKTALGLILDYPQNIDEAELFATKVKLPERVNTTAKKDVICAVVGSGNYSSRVLMPAIKKSGAQLKTVVSHGGVSATHHGKQNQFEFASSNVDDAFKDSEVDVVVVATRHDTHAEMVLRAIEYRKHVFVEKPMVLNLDQLNTIRCALQEAGSDYAKSVVVGFNRRFSPHVAKMKQLLSTVSEPKCFTMTMNAGMIPSDSWVQSATVGGGRIIGEACHYIDLMRFLADAPIVSYSARQMGVNSHHEINDDKAVITLGFADGSIGSINYFANGGKRFPKERIEVFAKDAVLQLDNFRKLRGFGWPGFKKMDLLQQNKGQDECVAAFIDHIRTGGQAPIGIDELLEVSEVTVLCAEELRSQKDNYRRSV